MIEIIKTENPDVVIERNTVDREVNLQEIKERLKSLQQLHDEIFYVDVLDIYPEEVKEIILESNRLKEIEKVGLLAEIEIMQERLNNLIWE